MARPTKIELENRILQRENKVIFDANADLLRQLNANETLLKARSVELDSVHSRLWLAREIITDQAQQIARLRRELAAYRSSTFTLYEPIRRDIGEMPSKRE